MGIHPVRKLLADSPGSLGWRQRERRARWLAEVFPDLPQMSIIDLGGRVGPWKRVPVRPKHVHVVNLEPLPAEIPDWAEVDHGDACTLPDHISKRRYDLVFSNSVIEHVGGHERRQRFAEAVHLLAEAHWVQTPYRYFPIEPHWVAPGLQFLPVAMRAEYSRRWPLGSYNAAATHTEAVGQVLRVELLDRTQMRYYFPTSVLRAENFFGLPKSLVAYRTGASGILPPEDG
jgi:hypothetical protein